MSSTLFNRPITISINHKTFNMLKALSELALDNENINPYRISKKAGVSWKTAKRFYKNNFNIKELK